MGLALDKPQEKFKPVPHMISYVTGIVAIIPEGATKCESVTVFAMALSMKMVLFMQTGFTFSGRR